MLPNSSIRISIYFKGHLAEDRDHLFKPDYQGVSLYAHLVDANFIFVQAINTTNKEWAIPRKTRLGLVSEYKKTNTFYIDPIAAPLAQLVLSSPGKAKGLAT